MAGRRTGPRASSPGPRGPDGAPRRDGPRAERRTALLERRYIRRAVTPPLVELAGVCVRLAGRPVLSDVSFALREGESWGLLGPNGSGKSTLLRVLRGELWPHHEGGGRRRFHLGGRTEESPIGARHRIGLVSPELQQEYLRRDWALPVEAVVRSGFTDSIWPPERATPEQAARIAEVLAALGIGPLASHSILELSTGEARKAILARALAPRPRLLFLDEPCHGLDGPSRASLLSHLSGVVGAGTSVVLATHRQGDLLPEIGRVAVLHAGRILAQGPRDEVLHRHRPRATAPAWTPAPAPAAAEGPPAAARGPIARIEHADVWVGGRLVLRQLSWEIRAGESWAVVGANGSGKSTLLRLLVGDEQAAARPGSRVLRLDLGDRAAVWEVKARAGLVSPDLQARHRADLPAEEVVASGFTASVGHAAEPSPAERAAAARSMARLGVSHLAGRRIHQLSYGELRRLLLARALVHDPELLLLDEPCDGLDPESREALLASVQALCEAGTRIVLVTHHLEDLVPAVTNVLELEAGQVVYRGPRAGWTPRFAP